MADPGDQMRAMLAAAMERPAPGRLARRERAAMAHALEVLRGGICARGPLDHDALIMLEIAGEHGCAECGAIERDASEARRDVIRTAHIHGQTVRRIRLVLCRLALYLRARLRADAGDCGRWRRVPSGKLCQSLIHNRTANGLCLSAACGCYTLDRRIAPLWQSATETRR